MNTPSPNRNRATITLLAVALLAGTPAALAQTTYTWTESAIGTQPWNDATNWDANGEFASGAGNNELRFFAGNTPQLTTSGTQTITSVPPTLSMNTLTLNGYARDNINGLTILFDPGSTWTIGDGTTSTINLNSIRHSFDARSIYFNLPNLALNQTTTTITGNGNAAGFIFAGNITQTGAGYGIIKSGTSRMDFRGNNTYTGTTEINGGILRLSHANALSGGIGATGGTSALTLNGGVIELAASDFMRNLGTGSDQFQITGGASGFSAVGADRVVTVNNDKNLELVWGSTHFQPTTLELNSLRAYGGTNPRPAETDTTNYDLTLSNRIDLNGATRNIKVDSKTAHLPGVIQNSSGTAGINKSGNGTLLLTAANTYNGDTTISGGTLSIENSGNAGVGGGIIFDGGTLGIRGTTLTQLSGLGHAVTINSNKAVGFDIHNAANTFTADMALTQSNGTLTKSGAGTLVLNQNNTFTGATTLTGGGTLVLDYSTNNGSKLSDIAALTLSGTTLTLSGGSHNEVVSGTTISSFFANSITRSSGTAVIHLNAITGNNNRNALSLSAGGIATTDTLNNATTGILGGWATVGSHLAINSTNTADGLITAYSGYTNFVSSGSVSTTNYQLLGSGSVSATQSMNTLRIENTADNQVLDLQANNLTVANFNGGNGGGVLLYAGGANNNYTITGTGLLSSTNNNGQSLGINVYQGTLTLDVAIANTGSNFLKTGAGTLIMTKARTAYTGTTYLLQGATRISHKDALGTGSIIVNAGAAFELSNDIAVGAKALSVNGGGISYGGALRNHSGSNSYAGAITIGASGARINSDASSSLSLTGGVVTALTQDVTFGGAGNTTVTSAGISGDGNLIKDGPGALTLGNTNTYTGNTTIAGGTLALTGAGSISNTPRIQINTSTTLDVTGLTGNFTLGASQTLAGGGTVLATGKTVNVSGTLSPGASPGTITQDGGTMQLDVDGDYNWQIHDASGAAGTGYDTTALINNATLDLSQLSVGNTFNINLWSLSGIGPDVNGDATNFNNALAYSWTLFSTGIAITGFDVNKFTINTGAFNGTNGFSNDLNGGSFSVGLADGGTDLVLNFTAVSEPFSAIPEPSSAVLLGALGTLALLRRRR